MDMRTNKYSEEPKQLPWIEEEHPAVDDAVCTEQFMDGAQQTDGGTGMSAPELKKKLAS